MSLASWLTQTAYRAAVASTDQYGKPVYGTPAVIKVRVERQQRMVVNAQGEDTPSSHKLWTLTAIAPTDRLWLPGQNSANPEAAVMPITVTSTPDKSGSRTLYEVNC